MTGKKVYTQVPALSIPTYVVMPHIRSTDEGQSYYTWSFETFFDVEGHDPPRRRMLCNLGNPLWTQDMMLIQISRRNGDITMPLDVVDSAMEFAQYHAQRIMGKPVVFHATQSGMKDGSYIVVSLEAHNHIAAAFDAETEGYVFANYLPLVYSLLSPGDIAVVPAVWDKAKHGEDGNMPADPTVWPVWSQCRIIVFDEDGWPKLVGKGTARPVDRFTGHERGILMNDTCIKWHTGIQEGDMAIVAPTPVTAKSAEVPFSWEWLQLWKINDTTLEYIRRKVREAIFKLMSPIKKAREGDRVPLLKQLGGLKMDGDLLSVADRNVIDAIRSNIPWCKELEDRLGRIVISIIVDRIIPSGGLFGRSYLCYQHDEIGKKSVPLTASGIKALAFRFPLTSMSNIAAFKRRIRDAVFHSDVLELMAGDSDGDKASVTTDQEMIDIFLDNHIDFEAGMKPKKKRLVGPLSPEFLKAHLVKAYVAGGDIGALTMAQHKLLTAGMDRMAEVAGQAAQAKPMEQKFGSIMLDGKPLEAYAARAMALSRALPRPQWRIAQEEAKNLSSPREIANIHIEEPESMMDHSFNFAAEAMADWNKENPLGVLNLVEISEWVKKVHGKFVLGNAEDRWLRTWKVKWGTYWADWHAEAEQGIYTPVGDFLDSLEAAGEEAGHRKLTALLKWIPASDKSDGFLLKWYMVGKLWCYIVGVHPSVIAHYDRQGYDLVADGKRFRLVRK